MSGLIRIYDRAPVLVQNLMLSAYGLWLRYLRYGPRQQALVAELRASERLSADALHTLQLKRLNDVLVAAARDVPFYDGRIPPTGVSSLAELGNLPRLTKSAAQQAGRDLVSRRHAAERLQQIHTGGTTGKPLTVFCNREALQRNYAFFHRFRAWAGITDGDRVATFAGRTIVPPGRASPYWRHNWASNTLLCSSYHLGPDSLDGYLDALASFRPRLIDSYPSSIEPLARQALARHDARIRPAAIITSSETLFPEVRASIEAAFGCRVFDHYGAAEMAALITQCEAGSYHVNPEYGVVEIMVGDRPALPGEVGEIVATGFVNSVMPFIRYSTGDLAVLGHRGCGCGRAFPVIERIEGRQDDTLLTPDGNRIGRLDPIFKAVQSIHEARIVQDAADHVRVEVVPLPQFSDRERHALLGELTRRLGHRMRISIVSVDRLERTGRGKLKTVVNLFTKSQSSKDEL